MSRFDYDSHDFTLFESQIGDERVGQVVADSVAGARGVEVGRFADGGEERRDVGDSQRGFVADNDVARKRRASITVELERLV